MKETLEQQIARLDHQSHGLHDAVRFIDETQASSTPNYSTKERPMKTKIVVKIQYNADQTINTQAMTTTFQRYLHKRIAEQVGNDEVIAKHVQAFFAKDPTKKVPMHTLAYMVALTIDPSGQTATTITERTMAYIRRNSNATINRIVDQTNGKVLREQTRHTGTLFSVARGKDGGVSLQTADDDEELEASFPFTN